MKLHHFNVMQTLKPANNNTSVILPYNNIQTLTPYVHVVSHHDNEIILIYWPTQLHCRLCHCSESDFRSFCCLLILTPLYSHVDESLLSKLHACQQTTLTRFYVKTFSFSCAISSFFFSFKSSDFHFLLRPLLWQHFQSECLMHPVWREKNKFKFLSDGSSVLLENSSGPFQFHSEFWWMVSLQTGKTLWVWYMISRIVTKNVMIAVTLFATSSICTMITIFPLLLLLTHGCNITSAHCFQNRAATVIFIFSSVHLLFSWFILQLFVINSKDGVLKSFVQN